MWGNYMLSSAPAIGDTKHVSIPAKQDSQVWQSGAALLLRADVTSVGNFFPFHYYLLLQDSFHFARRIQKTFRSRNRRKLKALAVASQ